MEKFADSRNESQLASQWFAQLNQMGYGK